MDYEVLFNLVVGLLSFVAFLLMALLAYTWKLQGSRVNGIGSRLTDFQLSVAKEYATRADLVALERTIGDSLARVEMKIDKLMEIKADKK